jgi:hypothetical protein
MVGSMLAVEIGPKPRTGFLARSVRKRQKMNQNLTEMGPNLTRFDSAKSARRCKKPLFSVDPTRALTEKTHQNLTPGDTG